MGSLKGQGRVRALTSDVRFQNGGNSPHHPAVRGKVFWRNPGKEHDSISRRCGLKCMIRFDSNSLCHRVFFCTKRRWAENRSVSLFSQWLPIKFPDKLVPFRDVYAGLRGNPITGPLNLVRIWFWAMVSQ